MNIIRGMIMIKGTIVRVENSGTGGLGEPEGSAVGDAGIGVDIDLSMLGA
jgi:hypothetical protein